MSENSFSITQTNDDAPSRVEDKGGISSFADIPPDAAFVTLPDSPPPSVIFKDMDDDGDLDIVISKPSPGQPQWLENTLGAQVDNVFQMRIFDRITPTALAVGDIDGDGYDDMVIGHMSGAKIFYNQPGWPMEDLGAILDNPRTIILEDINNDGQTDLLVRDSEALTLFQNTDGQLGIQSLAWPDLGDNPLLAVGNFNLTTQAREILVYQPQTKTLGIVAHNGQSWCCFQGITTISASKVLIADTNKDGVDEVYVEDDEGHTVVLESNGDGELTLNAEKSGMDISFIESSDASTSEDANSQDEPCTKPISLPEPVAEEAVDAPLSMNFMADPQPSLSNYSVGSLSVTPTTMGELNGTLHDDMLFSDDTAEYIQGYGGSDIIFGEGGDDFIAGNKGDDLIFGGDGDDTIHGGRHDDILFGEAGDDSLTGCKGNDLIFGGSGNDYITGGKGADILFGGAGADTFHFSSANEGNDHIAEFETGKDILEFDFGSNTFLNKADIESDMTGDAFVWKAEPDSTGRLYYDPDLTVQGDESLIAEIELADGPFGEDDISVI